MNSTILEKYNVPVPRYTSYPPANFFGELDGSAFEQLVRESNKNGNISFYIHIPYCRHLCHYCGCNSFAMQSEEKVKRYIDAVHLEIDRVKALLNPQRKISQIHYGGGSPTSIPLHYLKELNRHLMDGFSTIEAPEIAVECHPGYLGEQEWLNLLEAGFNRFSIGVQDFNEEVLKVVNRRPSKLPVNEIFQILRSKEVAINMDFIFGLPLQTVESFSKTIEKAIELHPDRLVTFSYAHVPWVNKSQLILERKGLCPPDEKKRIFSEAARLLNENGYRSIGLDHFVLPEDELYIALKEGKLHRNFQGYCTRRTTGQVYALGVTGISQLDNGYSQNTKSIEEYITLVEKGEWTVKKGYLLNEKEKVVREVIEQIMCNYYINWGELAERLNISVPHIQQMIGYDASLMRSFEDDGLIHWNEDSVTMTADGVPFVRNVAASFDDLYKTSKKSFSKPV